MGDLSDLLESRTLLEVSLPGTHDSLTAELGLQVPENANGLPPSVAAIVNRLPFRSKFMRDQAVTQVLSWRGQLEAGIRFFDVRVVHSRGDWWVLHFLQSKKPILDYFRQLREFLDAHPREVVVVAITHHNRNCEPLSGTAAEQRQFWSKLEALFGSLLFDHATSSLRTTTIGQMLSKGQQLVIMTADWSRFTGESTLALNACDVLKRVSPATGVQNMPKTQSDWISQIQDATTNSTAEKMLAVFWSTSSPTDQVKAMAYIRYVPLSKKKHLKKCAKSMHIPGSTYCPPRLLDVIELTNYYLQRVFDYATRHGLRLPNVVYCDYVTDNGLIQTDKNTGFAFVASVVYSMVRHDETCGTRCQDLLSMIAANNVTLINNPSRGRLLDWPPLPDEENADGLDASSKEGNDVDASSFYQDK